MSDQDPAVETWRETMPTSARLRHTEAELDSALSALAEALQARDEARAELAEAQANFEDTHADLVEARSNLLADLKQALRERDEALRRCSDLEQRSGAAPTWSRCARSYGGRRSSTRAASMTTRSGRAKRLTSSRSRWHSRPRTSGCAPSVTGRGPCWQVRALRDAFFLAVGVAAVPDWLAYGLAAGAVLAVVAAGWAVLGGAR